MDKLIVELKRLRSQGVTEHKILKLVRSVFGRSENSETHREDSWVPWKRQ